MDDEHDRVMQYPAWRDAITRLVRDNRLQPETLFEFTELCELFMIKQPRDDTPYAEAKRLELQFLGQFKEFETALLEEHQVALQNVRGVGYRIVAPHEQTVWAERSGIGEVRRAVQKLTRRLTNVDFMRLSAEGRRANADALARLGMMAGMVKQVSEFKLTPPSDE